MIITMIIITMIVINDNDKLTIVNSNKAQMRLRYFMICNYYINVLSNSLYNHYINGMFNQYSNINR